MGLGPIPAAAVAPAGVEASRGGGGRGGFIVWYEKEREGGKKEQNIYLRLLWKVGRKRNQKPMEKDFNGIHTEQNQQAT